jgi:MFS family permease
MLQKPSAMNPSSTSSAIGAGQSSAQGWYIVKLLSALYVLSFIDRFILALLAVPIGQDLGIADSQLGILVGLGFAVLYSIAGLPIAHYIDRYDRRYIVAGGVLLWSAMTIASAFATSFSTMIAARAGVAIGEAVLTPAMVSLVADLFPRERRALPVSIYAAVPASMASGSFVFGAAALDLAKVLSPIFDLAAWRLTFIIVGAPGILLGLIFLITVREPVRSTADSAAEPAADIRAMLIFLRREWRFFLPYYLGLSLGCIFVFGQVTWLPALLIRAHGFAPSTVGYIVGITGVTAGMTGAFAWPWLATRLERRGRQHAIMLCFVGAFCLASPAMILWPLSPFPILLIGGVALSTFAMNPIGCLNPLAIQTYGPARMRARLMAISLLAVNLIGFGLGPIIVPELAKNWPNDPFALGYALSTLGAIVGPLAAIAFFASWRSLKQRSSEAVRRCAPVAEEGAL